MREPLLLPASAFAAGIALSRAVPFAAGELLLPLCAFLGLAVLASRLQGPQLRRLCVGLAFVFGGILADVLHRPPPAPELDAAPQETVVLAGCVVDPPALYPGREQFVLEIAPNARVRVSLYLRDGESSPDLRYGQSVEVEARARRPRNFANPGSFDYAGYLARQDIYWTAIAQSVASIRRLEQPCGSRFSGFIFGIREDALRRIDRLYAGDSYSTGMMRAILIGDKSRLEQVWTDHFRFTGTYHAIVISGLHLTALAAVLLLVFHLFPSTDIAVLPVVGALAWLYALVTGWQTPVVRAAAGLTLYLLARFLFRRQRLLNLLAAVALAFLFFDPGQLFEASFQLSVLSVAAIAAFAIPALERTSQPLVRALAGLGDLGRDIHLPPKSAQFRVELRLAAETLSLLTGLRERWILAGCIVPLRLGLYVYELAAVSAAVQIGLVLPLVFYFHRLSFTGLSANILVVPLMSLVVPAGFLAVFTNWTLPGNVAGWLLDVSRRVVDWHVGFEPSWRLPDPPVWLAIALAAALVSLGVAMRAAPALRRITLAALAACLGLLLWYPFSPGAEPGTLELTAIDVGQGESLFVAFPDGKLMVMDGGGFPAFRQRSTSRLDTGEDVVSPYLWSRRIQRLDVVGLTHAHGDHMGGVAALLANFRPSELWTGAIPETPEWRALRAKAERLGVKIRPLRAPQNLHFGDTRVEVLSPSVGYEMAATARNSDSLALRIQYGARSFLLTGEINRKIESALLAAGAVGRSDVLKVAHHGSRTSSSREFLARVHPALAVLSAGSMNLYNYPHSEVIERLAAERTSLLRTDVWGLVSVQTDGNRLRAGTYRWAAPGPAKESPFPR